MKSLLPYAWIAAALALSPDALAQQTPQVWQRNFKNATVDTIRANAANKLAAHWANTNLDSSAFYSREAFALSKTAHDVLGQASAEVNLGNVSLVSGKLDQALRYFESAGKKFGILLESDPKNAAASNGLARVYGSCGIVFTQQSNAYRAIEQYERALETYRKMGNKTGVAKALNNIGIVYQSQQEQDKALGYFRKALQLQQELGEASVGVTMTNMGVAYFRTNRKALALEYYQHAQQLFKEKQNVYGLALVANHLGDWYTDARQPQQALRCYEEALQGYETLQYKFGAALALYNIGTSHYNQKNYAKALEPATRSLEYARALGAPDQRYHSEKLLSDVYTALQQPWLALEHYRNYVQTRDSISNQEHDRKFAVAEANFAYRQKEALLNEQAKRRTQLTVFITLGTLLLLGLIFVIYNRRQVKRRLTLQKEVAEYEQKALHLQMNPHFVFNCLGAISSFIVQNGTDSALKYLSKFSKLMRLTLEYSKGSLIPIDKEIESLRNYLELEQLRFNHKFDFTITQDENVEFNMGLPPLLVQPFVENAILHGLVPKKERGLLTVAFEVKAGQLWCTVTDDGIGLSESQRLKQDSVRAHQSMALEITRKRLEIMESTTSKSAQIEINELQHPSGTRVTLRLPVQYIP